MRREAHVSLGIKTPLGSDCRVDNVRLVRELMAVRAHNRVGSGLFQALKSLDIEIRRISP